jgi:hypothetical protein
MICSIENFSTPFTLGGHNFLASNSFLLIFSVTDAPRGGRPPLQKQWAKPTLSVWRLPILRYKIYRNFLQVLLFEEGITCQDIRWGNEYRASYVWWPHSHQIVAHGQLINQCSFPLDYDGTWIWSYKTFHTAEKHSKPFTYSFHLLPLSCFEDLALCKVLNCLGQGEPAPCIYTDTFTLLTEAS